MLVLRRLYSRQSLSSKYLKKHKVDPGITRQKKILEPSETEFDDFDFDELESDFMSLSRSHKEHVEEMERVCEREKYLIVQQKYFKEKFPNFLTWHDKEQIKYLHNSDPEEWTIEKLSEGFPALPDIIKKIVRNKWTKKNQNKVYVHDRTVIKNWQDFKSGKLNNLPEELLEHLAKFSNRALNLKTFETTNDTSKTTIKENNQMISGEFSEIIKSYERLKEQDDSKNQTDKDHLQLKSSYSATKNQHFNKLIDETNTKWNKKGLPLKVFQESLENKVLRGTSISLQEKLILKDQSNQSKQIENSEFGNDIVELKQEDISSIVQKKHENNSDKVGFIRKKTRDMSYLIYPEKINIPKKYFKQGYIYKLNDCYYDSDGEFLYRVPGMES